MASLSDSNDNDSSSSDSDDSIFYDANESFSTSETSTSLQHEPRWRISSQKSNRYMPITESQRHDIERRDKLQRLRSRDDTYLSNEIKQANIQSTSQPNLFDLNTIDRITKYGEIHPNSQKLNDDEILRQPIVRNLDNGKYIPLSDANPMTQTILERVQRSNSVVPMKDHNLSSSSSSSLSSQLSQANDGTSTISKSSANSSTPTTVRKQISKFVVKNLLRKNKAKSVTPSEIDDDEKLLINDGSNGDLKYKASRYLKQDEQFESTQLLQTFVNAHNGPIWCMKFSPDGHLLATGGQDSLVKIWALKTAEIYFNDCSRLTSNLTKQQTEILTNRFQEFHQETLSDTQTSTTTINTKLGLHENQAPLFPKPFCELKGHQASVLDVAWSKSLFVLSSSMDKTVRLWHLSRSECLCFFRHIDFVSAIAFHPRDDRYFVSASLDGHVRLWNIPDKRVVHWTVLPAQVSSQISVAHANLITAINFCDDGRKVTVGTFDGRFLIYSDSLQYETVMNVGEKDGSRSHQSRKKMSKPHKITGIESMNSNNSKVLITSTDSRIRLYDIRTKEIERKYRGYSNQSSQIRASFSHDDRYIISGSEDSWFYIWRTEPNATLTRKQRRYFSRAFERIRVHNTMVTSAIFAPNPQLIMNSIYSSPVSTPSNVNNRQRPIGNDTSDNSIYVMLTADSKGQLKLLVNRYYR